MLSKLLRYSCGLIFAGLLIGCQTAIEPPGEAVKSPIPQTIDIVTAQPSPVNSQEKPTESTRSTPGDNQPQIELQKFSSNSNIEILISGPASRGLAEEFNPFALQVDVVFHSPDGSSTIIPAFYDGDGRGGLDGDIWKARLMASQAGIWEYEVLSQELTLNGTQGKFEVLPDTKCEMDTPDSKNLACKGWLNYVGGHYLQFQNGDFWIKTGLDDPENFLGTAFGSWEAKRTQIDLLSSLGINSIYMITNNIDGDRKDTWPWIGETESEAKSNSDRFDLVKLQAWEDFFNYAEGQGVVLHFVFNDDSAWIGYNHELYIREMIARFSHHPGIIWNVGEEANESFSDQQQLEFAGEIRALDPYNHPVTVHRKSPWPFMGEQEFDTASIQVGDGGADFSSTELGDLNQVVVDHREMSIQRDHPIPIMIDETPRITEVNPEVREKFRKQVIYPIFFGGGSFELHYLDAYGQRGLVRIEDLEPLILDMVRLRHLLETFPYPIMESCNHLMSSTPNLCFGEIGGSILIYLPEGGSGDINLSAIDGVFEESWFNPRNGEIIQIEAVQGGQQLSFTAPDTNDWVLLLEKVSTR